MTLDTMEGLLQALRRLRVETGSLACLGCGHEHDCGVHGCAIIRKAMERLSGMTSADHPDITDRVVPLTLEQLREMDGKPVWVMEQPDWGHWELSEDADDYFSDRDPGLYGLTYPDPEGKGGIHKLGWIAYAYPPPHIDREAWEKPCKICNGKTTLYQHTNSTKLFMNTFGQAATLVTECNACPPYAKCCMKDVSANSAFRIKFCPECGRPLTEGAWSELEKRARGIKKDGT